MCNELERIAFCILRIIGSHLSPKSSILLNFSRTTSKDIDDDVILIDLILNTQDIGSSVLVSVDCNSLSSRNL